MEWGRSRDQARVGGPQRTGRTVLPCIDEETEAKETDPGAPSCSSQATRTQPQVRFLCPPPGTGLAGSSVPPSLPRWPHLVSSWAWPLRLGNTSTSQHLQSRPRARPPSPLAGLQLLALPSGLFTGRPRKHRPIGTGPCLCASPLPLSLRLDGFTPWTARGGKAGQRGMTQVSRSLLSDTEARAA